MGTQEVQKIVDTMARRIAERFTPDRILLFGSYAKGTATYDSDVDLLVVMPIQGSVREAARNIDAALSDRTLPLDLIVLTSEQFERQKSTTGTIANTAVREGKVLYERAA